MNYTSVGDPKRDAHINGEYLRRNPTWHSEHSQWKAENLLGMIRKHELDPRLVCDVGCGVGEVLRQLQLKLNPSCRLWGYDIAPDAIAAARQCENERLKFELADFAGIETPPFDLLIMTEVVDHVEDYLRFLRVLRHRAEWKLFSFSLDFCTESSVRPVVFSRLRENLSHLHHFNKVILMDMLQRTGYQVADSCYMPWRYRPARIGGRLFRSFKRLVYATDPDLAARLFIGYNLIVLAR